jgi:hypothetical protein
MAGGVDGTRHGLSYPGSPGASIAAACLPKKPPELLFTGPVVS